MNQHSYWLHGDFSSSKLSNVGLYHVSAHACNTEVASMGSFYYEILVNTSRRRSTSLDFV